MKLLQIADVAVLLMAGFGGYILRFGAGAHPSPANHLFVYLSTVFTLVSLNMAHAYRVRFLASLYSLLSTLLVGTLGAFSLILVCSYFSGTLHAYSRIWLVSSALGSFALLTLNRIAIVRVAQSARQTGTLAESIVVVGANECADMLIKAIRNEPHSNVSIRAVFDDRADRDMPEALRGYMLGSTNTMLSYIRRNRIDRLVVALPWVATDRIEALLKKLRTIPVRIDLVPNNVVWRFPATNMERLGGVPILTIANQRVDEQMGTIKRLEDLVISLFVLLLVSPLLLLIAVAIKLDSKGPVIFKQRRHGFNNQVFEVYKFRSMTVADSASGTTNQATRDDRRVTAVGRFLRRSSLDELPQLFNVLIGDMSVVGPRPHAVQHNIEFGNIILEYYARHNVKPGITGWAQVNGLRGETDTVDKMNRRVEFDLHYIENWSLLMDLKIVLMTSCVVWFQANAY
jgi:Undecaprenyl-phosphate glucose phosphotransferase